MRLLLLTCFLFFPGYIFSQQAENYFPGDFGYVWNYRISVLDSLNNPIPDLIVSRTDSSVFTEEYNGLNAHHILTKSGPPDLIQFLPFTDTNYVHFSGSDAYEYRHVSEIEFILSLVDSSTLNTLLPFIGLFEAFSGWYRSYRFAHNINQQYQVAVIDTIVYYDSLEIPLRRSIHGKRLEDENLETALGPFLCKKFVITSSINYLIILPDPLPPVAIPIITSLDTIWIAPGNWIVKDIIPSTNIDLTIVNLGEYNIPGLKREIAANVTGIKQSIYENHTFNLHQNYPNPFNPSTKLKFTIKKNGYVLLRVFDVLGREIDKIVNGNLDKGNYEFNFDASALSSGTYFYTLEFSETGSEFTNREIKKMSLIK